jgi:hypothetical protein
LTISIAASIVVWGCEEGYAVGLLTNSLMVPLSDTNVMGSDGASMHPATTTHTSVPRVRVPFASDHGQRQRLLLALARLLPYLGEPIDQLLEEERDLLPRETTVVLVSATAALTSATIERLVDRKQHGINVHFVLIGDPEQQGKQETYDVPVSYIEREVWHELVKTHDEAGRSSTALHLD